MRLIWSILTLLALLALVACGAQESTVETTQPPTPTAEPTVDLSQLVISLERGVCFGFCPIYRVTIEGDGTVTWEGEQHVEVVGTETAQIEPEQVQELVAAFQALDFFALKDSYTEKCEPDGTCSTVTDLPSTTTTINLNGQIKSVTNYYGGPEGLAELEIMIDEIANTQQWIGTPQP